MPAETETSAWEQSDNVFLLSLIVSQVMAALGTLINELRSVHSLGAVSNIGMNLGTRFGPEILALYVVDRTFRAIASKLFLLFRRISGRGKAGSDERSNSQETS